MRVSNSLAAMGKSQGAELRLKGRAHFIRLSFEEHPKKSPGFGVNGNVEVCVLHMNAECPYSWKKGSSDGLC